MRDDGGGSSAAPAPRGLVPCAQCQTILPGARLKEVAGQYVCGGCARKLQADDGAEAEAPPEVPSRNYGARLVGSSSEMSGGPVASASGTQFAGRYRPRPAPWKTPSGREVEPHTPGAYPAPQPLPGGGYGASDADSSPLPPPPEPSAREPSGSPFQRFQSRGGDGSLPWAQQSGPAAPATGSPAASQGADPPRPRLTSASARAWEPQPVARPAVAVAVPPADPLQGPAAAGPSASTSANPARSRGDQHAARFEDYAALRQSIDAGEDNLPTRKRAAEMAARLGLHLEAVEHYRRCAELAPNDEAIQRKLENVVRSVGADHGGAPAPTVRPQQRIAEEARPFWEDLGDAVSYPFRGAGVTVLLVGGALFGIGELIASFNMFAAAVNIALYGYVAAYLFDVINHTGSGKRDAPELPEAANFLESYVFPFFAFATCVFLSFVPCGLVAWAGLKGFLPGPVAIVLSIVAFAFGFFVLPMTLMVRAMFQSIGEAARPAHVLGSIGRIFPDYVAMFIATVVLWVTYGIACGITYFACWMALGQPSAEAVLALDFARIASWVIFTLVTWPLFLYAWMLQGHLLGRLYRQGVRRLAWFVQATEATQSARRMSAGLWCGAAVAVAALCGAVFVGTKAVERWRLAPNSAVLGAKCPVAPGARMVYFWENTDGMAGLTEYRFHKAGGGLLRVTAATHVAGQGKGGEETVGTFDPDTGAFVEAATAWGHGVHHDGRKGEHVSFFGPKKSNVGSTYLNEWPVRGVEKWKDVWNCWKVHDEGSTRDLYFDQRSGVLVGSRFVGIGYEIREWLVEAQGVSGVSKGVAANRNFDVEPEGAGDLGGFPDFGD